LGELGPPARKFHKKKPQTKRVKNPITAKIVEKIEAKSVGCIRNNYVAIVGKYSSSSGLLPDCYLERLGEVEERFYRQ
jgi:hypothetical protein